MEKQEIINLVKKYLDKYTTAVEKLFINKIIEKNEQPEPTPTAPTNFNFSGVIVGKILEVNPHPNADRLRLTKVDTGDIILDIVCGAPNIAPGQVVPVAMIGAILPGNFEIKESEIRGEKSFGMLCAEDELGLGSNHDGIMILKETAAIGQNFSDYLKNNQ